MKFTNIKLKLNSNKNHDILSRYGEKKFNVNNYGRFTIGHDPATTNLTRILDTETNVGFAEKRFDFFSKLERKAKHIRDIMYYKKQKDG